MNKVFAKAFYWYFTKSALPYWYILIVDCLIVIAAGFVAAYLFVGGANLAGDFWHYLKSWLMLIPFCIISMRVFHTYSVVLRYSTIIDLINVAYSILLGFALAIFFRFILPDWMYIQSIPLKLLGVMAMLSMIGQCGVRILMKLLFDAVTERHRKRVFIYGIMEGGMSLAKAVMQDRDNFVLSGFVSPDGLFESQYLLGVKVYPCDDKLVEEMKKTHSTALVISPIQTESFREKNELIDELISNDIKIMMVPNPEEWEPGKDVGEDQIREVDIEDLLPRDKIEVDLNAIGEMLTDKTILITGAAGSIGGEMSRQVAKFNPKVLVLVDQAETPMHDVRLYMSKNHPALACYTIVGNIANKTHMEQLFSEYRPEYVFHAAAYKHVPMMEDNPAMAIQNNVYGTRVIADLAVKYGTNKFVMISTDKAVNPTNVMGCSKRICEIYCQSLNKAIQDGTVGAEYCELGTPKTQFITTRFGNVLGSNGSVIPIFREQIRKGGPLTVTHPDIIRFFMLIPEACQLVLEAGTMGHGGEIFIFDMGKPVRIADLAKRMIDLSGAKNVEIKYTGLRDGEKLYEEVLNDAEQTKPTIHPKIKIAAVREYPFEQAHANEEELYKLSLTYDDMLIVKKMKEIVPEYKSQNSKYEALDVR